MPRISDKIPIKNELLDKRVKLTKEKKEEVRKLRKEGYSMRQLAERFGVSRRLIQFTIYPERLEKVNYPGHWAKYFDRKKLTEAQRKHRAYKKELFKQGKIGGES